MIYLTSKSIDVKIYQIYQYRSSWLILVIPKIIIIVQIGLNWLDDLMEKKNKRKNLKKRKSIDEKVKLACTRRWQHSTPIIKCTSHFISFFFSYTNNKESATKLNLYWKALMMIHTMFKLNWMIIENHNIKYHLFLTQKTWKICSIFIKMKQVFRFSPNLFNWIEQQQKKVNNWKGLKPK